MSEERVQAVARKADEPAEPIDYQQMTAAHWNLAGSLVCYVKSEDKHLTREQFLRLVVGRIQDDLAAGTF